MWFVFVMCYESFVFLGALNILLNQFFLVFMWCTELNKILSACGEHEIKNSDYRMNNNFTCVFIYTSCAIKCTNNNRKSIKTFQFTT